jgi:penicillin-binding protein 1C
MTCGTDMARSGIRRLIVVTIGAAIAGATALGAAYLGFEAYVAALPAPDLSRAARLSAVVLSEDKRVLKTYLAEDQTWRLRTTEQDVPPHYLSILLAYEDQRFLSHRGIDVLAILRASYLLARHGRVISGASTLTMQTIRLLEKQERGWRGKLRQMALAVKLERQLDKSAILSLYLSLAPFGGNVEGVRAASLQYFGVEPSRLTIAQSALLVALPQAPERRRPDTNAAASRDARNWVLQRMAMRGVLSREQAAEARREPIPSRRGAHATLAHHLSDKLHAERPNEQELRTFIDRRLQMKIETMASEYIGQQPDRCNVAVVVVRNRDMAVSAYVGGADYFNTERAGMLDLARAVRSPGSALKPVIYGLAFEELIVHPSTIVVDDVIQFRTYAPENFDKKFRGEMLARDALIRSVNTVAVMLLDAVGADRFVNRLRAADIAVELPESTAPPGLAVALGGLGISLENLAKLYAGIANRGKVRGLRYVEGEPVASASDLMEPDAAWAVADILADMPGARGRLALRSRSNGRRVAYKTGTSYGYKDAWSIGFDADHVVAVWIGRPDGIGRGGETGATSAVPMMQRIFEFLPAPERDVAGERPLNSVLAMTRDIPQRLLRYQPRPTRAGHPTMSRPFEIRFPVNGSTMRLSRHDGVPTPLTVWVSGGQPPFRWFVDGRSVADRTSEGKITWIPGGRGQVEFVVIDNNGHKASSSAWLD